MTIQPPVSLVLEAIPKAEAPAFLMYLATQRKLVSSALVILIYLGDSA